MFGSQIHFPSSPHVSRTYWRPCAPRRRHVARPVEVAKVSVRGFSVAGGEGVGELLGAHAVDGHGKVAAKFRKRKYTEWLASLHL